MTVSKKEKLESILKDLGSVVVAYSGGVDSTFLLKKAVDVIGRDNVLAVTAGTALLSPDEVEACRTMARDIPWNREKSFTTQAGVVGLNPIQRPCSSKTDYFLHFSDDARGHHRLC